MSNDGSTSAGKAPTPNDDGPGSSGRASPIRLLVVDDHAMVAEGFATALGAADDIDVVGSAATVAEAVEQARRHQPDVALVDFRLPDGTGALATREIRSVSPNTAVVIITAFSGPEIIAQAIEAGCSGFLRKNEHLDELLTAVRGAANGETLFTRELLTGLVERLRNPEPVVGADLSVREMEVLRLLAQGCSTDRIADDLIVSRHTARNHIQNVLMKLGAHSKLEAVAIALRERVIDVEDLRE